MLKRKTYIDYLKSYGHTDDTIDRIKRSRYWRQVGYGADFVDGGYTHKEIAKDMHSEWKDGLLPEILHFHEKGIEKIPENEINLPIYKQEKKTMKLEEGLRILVRDRRTGKPVASDHVGDVIDKHGNEHYESPMHYHKMLSDYATKHPHHEVTVINDFGQKQTIMPRKRSWLGESPELPAFSDAVHQKDKALHSLLSQHGHVEVEPWTISKDYAKTFYLKHPANKDHTLIVAHTLQGDNSGEHVVGYRPSKKTDHLLSFDHYKHWNEDFKEKKIASNHKMTKDDAFDDNFHHLKRYLETGWKKVGTMNESYNLVENTKRVFPDNLMSGYSKFISKQNSYNNLGVIQEEKLHTLFDEQGMRNQADKHRQRSKDARARGDRITSDHESHMADHHDKMADKAKKDRASPLGVSIYGPVKEGFKDRIKDALKTHEPDSFGTYDTDSHETEAAFAHTLNRFREAGSNKWDLHIRGSHGKRIAGQNLTKLGQRTQWLTGAKAVPHKSTGTLIGTFQHKENPDHKIDFALGRTGNGGTKIISATHNMSGSAISNASPADMEHFMGKLTRTAKQFVGLTERRSEVSLDDHIRIAKMADEDGDFELRDHHIKAYKNKTGKDLMIDDHWLA